MRSTHDGIDLIKTCPACDRFIPIAHNTCSFCGYVYEPVVLDQEEEAWSYAQTVELINDGFFRLENFGKGNVSTYHSFPFGRMFSILFHKTRLPENQTQKNYKRLDRYYALTGQMATDFDKNNFDNSDALKNDYFVEDLEDITHINSERYWEFLEFELPGKKDRLSITDLMEEEIIFEEAGENPLSYNRELSINDHFDKIRTCEITELERYNLAQMLTDNFNLDKLRLLYSDLEFYLFVEKEEMESRFSDQDVEETIKRWKSKGMTIPTRTMPILKKKGEAVNQDEKPTEVLDKERLLYSAEFFCCYRFKAFLTSKIVEAEKLLGIYKDPKDIGPLKKIKDELTAVGFYDLSKVDALLPRQQQKVLDFIAAKEIPHVIALLDQLGLPEHIRKTQAKTKTALHKKLAQVLGCPERTIKGNLNALNELSREDRTRYTAHLHIAAAKKFLEDLK